MRYEFPMIQTLDDVLRFRATPYWSDVFGVWTRPNGTVVIDYNYLDGNSFRPIGEHDFAPFARELRGITFNAETGDILSRPYHKFFNIGEREETLPHNVPIHDPHHVLEKLDGSMVHAFIQPDGDLVFATRAGVTDIARTAFDFALKTYPKFASTVREFCARGMTPVFEYMSPENMVVVRHRTSKLILTGGREHVSGQYLSYHDLQQWGSEMGVPVVGAFDPVRDLDQWIASVRGEQENEGYIVRFPCGAMAKVKNDWYVKVHKTRDGIARENYAVELALSDGLDDVLPTMLEEDRIAITKLRDDLSRIINESARRVNVVFQRANREITIDRDADPRGWKKEFFMNYTSGLLPQERSALLFLSDRGIDPHKTLHETILRETGSGARYDAIAKQMGLPRWSYRIGDLDG